MENLCFFAMLSRMKNINRWGLMRNVNTENVCEHSFDTAVIAHALALIKNNLFGGKVNAERVALLAVFHDATEIITGDLPTPVKYYNNEIRSAYAEIEKNAKEKLLSELPDYLKKDYEPLLDYTEEEKELWCIVKAADKISALIKCIQEKNMGNLEFDDAYISTKKAIEAMKLPEANYFLENFLESYILTIDKQ